MDLTDEVKALIAQGLSRSEALRRVSSQLQNQNAGGLITGAPLQNDKELMNKFDGKEDFEATVSEIRKRDRITRTQAMAKARVEHPDSFEAFQKASAYHLQYLNWNMDMTDEVKALMSSGLSRTDAMKRVVFQLQNQAAGGLIAGSPLQNDKDLGKFEALVQEEIRKGSPASVAAQRVGLKYPDAAASVMAKGKTPFETEVDNIQEQDGCSRSEAMARARKKHPVKFAHYNEIA
jgi:uncharacterized protein YoaH (UPF0181 family)